VGSTKSRGPLRTQAATVNVRRGALLRITVLHMPGCHGGRAALDVAAMIAEHRLDVSVHEVIIEDERMATWDAPDLGPSAGVSVSSE
jgi:hypothetical protein